MTYKTLFLILPALFFVGCFSRGPSHAELIQQKERNLKKITELRSSPEQEHSVEVINLLAEVSDTCFALNQHNEVRSTLSERLSVALAIHGDEAIHIDTAIALFELGKGHMQIKEHGEAESCFTKSLSMLRQLEQNKSNTIYILGNLIYLGNVHYAQNETEKARLLLFEYRDLLEQLGD